MPRGDGRTQRVSLPGLLLSWAVKNDDGPDDGSDSLFFVSSWGSEECVTQEMMSQVNYSQDEFEGILRGSEGQGVTFSSLLCLIDDDEPMRRRVSIWQAGLRVPADVRL